MPCCCQDSGGIQSWLASRILDLRLTDWVLLILRMFQLDHSQFIQGELFDSVSNIKEGTYWP